MSTELQTAAPNNEGSEQTHYGKMVICNLAGGGCLFAAGGFSGNLLLMGAGLLQLTANGLLYASGKEKHFNAARREQMRRFAYALFAINSCCSIAAGIGLGEIGNPLAIGDVRPEMLILGAFGLGGGMAGARKTEPTDNPTKLIDLFRVNLPNGQAKPHWPTNPADVLKINMFSRAGRQGWWQGLNSNKAASAWYMFSGGAPLVVGTVGLVGALVVGAPAAIVTAAAITVGIGAGYTLGNFCLAASKPKAGLSAPAVPPSAPTLTA